MPPRIQKTERLDEMSNEEQAELQKAFIDLRSHADRHLEAILKIMQHRLENNLVK